jgi:hypothetical protein
MRETKVERYLKRRCEEKGYPCRKNVSPGRNGVLDRVVLLRRGKVVWVETKKPKKGLEEHQAREFAFLRALGHVAELVNTYELVDQFVEKYLCR